MAIIPSAQKVRLPFINSQMQRQKKMIYLLVLVILVTAGIYFFYINKPSWLGNPAAVPVSNPDVQANLNLIDTLRKSNLDISLLEDKKFQNLVLPGENPVVVGQKGRPNPFTPF